MVGYLFLFVSLFAGVSKGYCGKKTSRFTEKISDAVFVNFIRMLLCTLIGALFVFVQTGKLDLSIPLDALWICALSGITLSSFVVFWLLAVKSGAYMTVEITLTAATLIPIVVSNILWNEAVTLVQIFGFALLLLAVYIMCSYNKQLKGAFTPRAIAYLILLGVSNGLCDLSQKIFVRTTVGVPASVFNFYAYVFSTLTLFVVLLFSKEEKSFFKMEKKDKYVLSIYVIFMAVLMFVNTYFKTLAATKLDSVILYPLRQGGALMLCSFMRALLFKEGLSIRAICGIALAVAALLIINVL